MPISMRDRREAFAGANIIPASLKKTIMAEFVEQSDITLLLKSIAMQAIIGRTPKHGVYRFVTPRFYFDISIDRHEFSVAFFFQNGPQLTYPYTWFQKAGYTPITFYSVLHYIIDHSGPVEFVGDLGAFMETHRDRILLLQTRRWDENAVIRKGLRTNPIVAAVAYFSRG